jgi:hypothetical protein
MRFPLIGLEQRRRVPAAPGLRAPSWYRVVLVSAIAVTVATALLVAGRSAYAGGLDTSLCSPASGRVTIPSSLPVSACFDGHNLVVKNTLQFPIEVHTDHGGVPVVAPLADADLPGAMVSLAEPAGAGLTPPNYRLTIPITSQQTTITLTTAPSYVISDWIWDQRLYDALGYNDVVKIGQALASLIGELTTVTQNYRTCLINRSSWLDGSIGCMAGYDGNVFYALGRFGIKALTPGIIEASYNLIMTALNASQAASQVSAWNNSTRQFTIAAAPGTAAQGGSSGNGKTSGGNGTAPAGPASATVSNSNGQMLVRLSNFPLGATHYFCHSGSGYPTGGSISSQGSVSITAPGESLGALCSGSGNAWIGFQGTDGHDYYSNQVILGTTSAAASASGGQMLVQLANFPLGTTYYFCHSGSGYPTGGTIVSHSSVDVTSAGEDLGALCSGSGNSWVGFQGTDGHDYYSNQVTLG